MGPFSLKPLHPLSHLTGSIKLVLKSPFYKTSSTFNCLRAGHLERVLYKPICCCCCLLHFSSFFLWGKKSNEAQSIISNLFHKDFVRKVILVNIQIFFRMRLGATGHWGSIKDTVLVPKISTRRQKKQNPVHNEAYCTIVEKTFRHHERSVATWAYCTGLYKYTETFKGQNTRHAGKVITEILNKY